MCGRFTSTEDKEKIIKLFPNSEVLNYAHKSYNISPSNIVNIIYENNNINADSLLQIIKNNTIILKKLAIKKKDTIAIVLENGPEFITTFLSCINSTVAAPLNPNYTASEFDFYFKDLKPKALITNLPSNHPSIKICYKNKVKIVRLEDFLFKVDKKSFKNNNI